MPERNPVKFKTIETIPKADDLKLAVRTMAIEGVEYIDIRDYVPSTKTFGKGVVFRRHVLPDLVKALSTLDEYLGGSSSSTKVHPDQQKLF